VTTQVPLQQLFREEALQTLQRGADDEGDLLRISPAWTRWAYWVLVAAVLAALAYGVLGTVNEYAPGPAVVRVAGRVDVTATSGGTVVAIDVQPGQRVTRGQSLVRFHDAGEAVLTVEEHGDENRVVGGVRVAVVGVVVQERVPLDKIRVQIGHRLGEELHAGYVHRQTLGGCEQAVVARDQISALGAGSRPARLSDHAHRIERCHFVLFLF